MPERRLGTRVILASVLALVAMLGMLSGQVGRAIPLPGLTVPGALAAPCPTPVSLVNGSFETPDVPNRSISLHASIDGWTGSTQFALVNDGRVGRSTPYGEQFAGLTHTSRTNATISQMVDVTGWDGSTFTWSFAHRGVYGNDTIRFQIEAIAPTTSMLVNETRTTGNGSAGTGNSVIGDEAWTTYSGTVAIPVGTTQLTIRLIPVSITSDVYGNEVDNVTLTSPEPPACTTDLVVTKTVDQAIYVPGEPVDYTIQVTNEGAFDASDATLSDAFPTGMTNIFWTCTATGGGSCTASGSGTLTDIIDVPVGATVTYTVTGTAPSTSPPVTLVNRVSVTPAGRQIDSDTSNNTARASSTLGTSTITLAKTTTYTGTLTVGEVIPYTFTVTNTGTVPLLGVSIEDTLIPEVTCPSGAIAANGGSVTCTGTYEVTQADKDAGTLTNSATATGDAPGTLTDPTATDAITIEGTRTPGIALVKTAEPSSGVTVGDQISWSFRFQNTGDVTLSGITVTDTLPGISAITCPTDPVPPQAIAICSATSIVTQEQVDAGEITNSATITGTAPEGTDPATVSAEDSITVTIEGMPALSLSKSVEPTSGAAEGDTLTWTFTLTNTGNVTITGITVEDTLAGLSAIECAATELAPAASTTCTATSLVSHAQALNGSITNTATSSGTTREETTVTSGEASATVEVIVPTSDIDLNLTANADGIIEPGSEITWTYVITNTGNQTLSQVTLEDGRGDAFQAAAGPEVIASSLAPGESLTITSQDTVTQAEVESGSISNTATVSGIDEQGGSVSDTETVTLASCVVIPSPTPSPTPTDGTPIVEVGSAVQAQATEPVNPCDPVIAPTEPPATLAPTQVPSQPNTPSNGGGGGGGGPIAALPNTGQGAGNGAAPLAVVLAAAGLLIALSAVITLRRRTD